MLLALSPMLAGSSRRLASSSSVAIQTLQLTSAAASGTHYFSGTATVIAAGLAPGTVTTDLPGCQVEVLQRWNDGSVSNVRISGHAAFTQNSAKTITLLTGTPPSGTALTQADIPAGARGTYSITWGSDTVTFNPVSDTPYRTWISGHEVSEWHFVGDIGTTNSLAWLYLRQFADGRVECLPFIETPFLDNSAHTALATNTDQTKTVSFVVNGAAVFNNGGASLTLRKNARFKGREEWYTAFGTDPQITPSHSPSALIGSRKFPNYVAPNSTCLNAQTLTYTPTSNGQQVAQMGAQGDAPSIAPLPEWTAAYVASGDSRAWKGMLTGSSHLNSYAICYRRKSTKEVMRPSDFGTWTVNGPGAGGSNDTFAGTLQWELSHHPGESYGPWLLTGDAWHYETMLFNAATVYLCQSSSGGSGTSRLMRNQTRGVAWSLRTLAMVAAAAPDADRSGSTPAADYRAMLATNIADMKATLQGGGNMADKGCFYQYSYGNGSNGTWPDLTGSDLGCVAPWMYDFLVAQAHVFSDAQPLASMTDYDLVRSLVSKWVIGRFGATGDTAQFPFVRAALYGMQVATDGTGATWLATWGDIFTNTNGSSNSSTSNTLLGSSGSDPTNGPIGYWGYLRSALAMCKDHGETGADAAWTRLIGASNYSTLNTAGFDTHPAWSILPRA